MRVEERLQKLLNHRNEQGLERSLKTTDDLIDFCSNDYLGLSHDTALVKQLHKQATLSVNDLGSGGSRLLAGNTHQHEDLEFLLAKVHQSEAALLFNSGYSANLGLFSSVPQKGDVVFYDDKIHACIKDGMRLSYAKYFSFRHNDLEHLERRLKSVDANAVFIAVESIYSMDGDTCPLVNLVNLANSYNAHVIVDEAHSTAICGEAGAGLIVQLGLQDQVFARVHTFGKGLGSHGACVVGNAVLKRYLVNNARSFIYTTSLPVHHVELLKAIYLHLEQEGEELQGELTRKIHLFKSLAKGEFVESNSPIQALLLSGNEKVKAFANKLQNQGFDLRPVMSPTVPVGQERIRICLHNHNTDDEIRSLCEAINKEL